MNNGTRRLEVESWLRASSSGDFASQARELLAILGYRSDRTLPGQTGSVEAFIETFPADNRGTVSEQLLSTELDDVQLVFQVTDEEIAVSEQSRMLDPGGWEDVNARSFLFVAANLKNNSYPRGAYAQITREINKRFLMPTVVFLRTKSGLITAAFVHRRPRKSNEQRDVLGSVSLLREIDTSDPHRAHVDILSGLSLDERLKWLDDRKLSHNFDGLLDAWLSALDTEELNRRFYSDLTGWFDTARQKIRLPDGHQAIEPVIIRLVTRLIFVWFMKEKGLVVDDLFHEDTVKRVLVDYDLQTGSSYYRAILQNLFFATLNTEVDERGFSSRTKRNHNVFQKYRYRDEIADEDHLLGLFAETPFVNGGLFDCLDSVDGGSERRRVDFFTDNPNQRKGFSVPNRLFFGAHGLIRIFEKYKFTVEENTPATQEVALDPELMGNVFENLLVTQVPEIGVNARNETGSFYTPRHVVDFMVEESLVSALASKSAKSDEDKDWMEDRLHYLFDYQDAFDDASDLFTDDEARLLVRAISRLRLIDPAVGSGAFPMGALHKLTMGLGRLDPENKLWEEVQREIAGQRSTEAFSVDDHEARDERLVEISKVFERYKGDYGRKLFLIQNNLFGVDIQPVACQISRLRFFITLAIEQERQDGADNHGFRVLPNLDTRFVAADSLLSVNGRTQHLLTDRARVLLAEIEGDQERYFHASSRQSKSSIRDTITRNRTMLADELESAGFDTDAAARLVSLDTFNPESVADWFDPQWMFGIEQSFDIVVGNPPYIQLQRNEGELKRRYEGGDYKTFDGTGDIYQLFIERAVNLLDDTGVTALIVSNSWTRTVYGSKTREFLLRFLPNITLIEAGSNVFPSSKVDSCILIGSRSGRPKSVGWDSSRDQVLQLPPDESAKSELVARPGLGWFIAMPGESDMLDRVLDAGEILVNWDVTIRRGIITGAKDLFVIGPETREMLVSQDPKSEELIAPVIDGQDIERYAFAWNNTYLIGTHNGYGNTERVNIEEYPAIKSYLTPHIRRLEKRHDRGGTPYHLRNCTFYGEFASPTLMWARRAERAKMAYVQDEIYCESTSYFMSGDAALLKYLLAVLNSKVVSWFVNKTAATTNYGVISWDAATVTKIPIPKASCEAMAELGQLSDLMTANAASAADQLSETDRTIDGMLYDLYGLTRSQVEIVEEAMRP